MTTGQIRLIPSPENGLQVYCTDNGKLYIFVSSSGQWKEVAYGPTLVISDDCFCSFTNEGSL